ncbi:hypothetical protein EON63_09835 [archaeon]|nr:MAG: hypothetical protein EON63_09835 [archaeon]
MLRVEMCMVSIHLTPLTPNSPHHTRLEWANERISKLELALQQATAELKARAELAVKWEVKEGEMQKRLDDLEKYVCVCVCVACRVWVYMQVLV